MNERIRAFWQERPERERVMLAVLGVFISTLFVYLALYAPLKRAVNEARLQWMDTQATLSWMKKVQPLATKRVKAEALDASKLLTVFSEQLNKHSFSSAVYHLQQVSHEEIQLSFDAVPYNASMDWLLSMSQRYIFSLKQVIIDRTDKPGVVKLNIVMSVI